MPGAVKTMIYQSLSVWPVLELDNRLCQQKGRENVPSQASNLLSFFALGNIERIDENENALVREESFECPSESSVTHLEAISQHF